MENISTEFCINKNNIFIFTHYKQYRTNYFENLVVKVDSTTIPKAYIIKYVLNSNPIFISEHNAYTLDAQTEITQINYNDTEAKIEYYDGCAVVTLWCPYDGPHPAGPECLNQRFDDLYWVRDTSGCGDGLDSGGGGSSGPVDTTGGGGSSGPVDTTGGGGGAGGTGDLDTPHNDSGNNNPIVTAPVLELEEEEAPKKTPCEELKKLINNIECKDAISNLEGHLSEDKEYGFAYEALPNSSDLDELHPIESLPDEPLKLQMGNYIGGNFIGANHLHPRPSTSGAVPMFAADDVAWLFKVAKAHLPDIPLSQKDFSVYFLTLTVGSGTYAIKIKDGLKFYTFMMRTSYKEFKESLEDKFIELGVMASASTLKREFLKILNKNVDSGIGLYQLKEDKTDWEELVFNPLYPNSDPVIKPCNAK